MAESVDRSPSDERNAAETEATFDEELDEKLGVVDDARELYLEEASFYRPISTGDVFLGASVAGASNEEEASGLAMVLSHPSAMRKGPVLADRLRAGPVLAVRGIHPTKYKA